MQASINIFIGFYTKATASKNSGWQDYDYLKFSLKMFLETDEKNEVSFSGSVEVFKGSHPQIPAALQIGLVKRSVDSIQQMWRSQENYRKWSRR